MSTLKELAKEAKKRMINNEYSHIGHDAIKPKEEERYYTDKSIEAIVMEIAASEDIVVNPIGRLVDQKYYQALTDVERERYILNLAEKYQNILKKVNF